MTDRRRRFAEEGWLHLPGFLDAAAVARFRAICDRVLGAWRAENAGAPWLDRSTNMAFLTEPRYFAGRGEELTALLELIAAPAVLALLEEVAGGPTLFHNTQYFPRPTRGRWHGPWHRDTQFVADDPDLERRRMAATTGVHFRIAFADDPNLAIVPGSHRRWDTAAELAVRKAADPDVRADGPMPGAIPLPLARGDALLFHAWSIHRGTYDASRDRATFDVIHGWGAAVDWAAPPPTCFGDPAVLDRLSPDARSYFDRFARTYRPFWEATQER